MMCVSVANVFFFFFFPLKKRWLKSGEEGAIEMRLLNRSNVLVLIKCEVWEKGGRLYLMRFVTNKEIEHLSVVS